MSCRQTEEERDFLQPCSVCPHDQDGVEELGGRTVLPGGQQQPGALWPPVVLEELPWHRDPDELVFASKRQRQRIRSTYWAAVPPAIADRDFSLSQDILSRMDDLMVSLARFDAGQQARGYNLPALLLRSESAASSQIENLTSSVRNVALAELSDGAPHNARLIAGNVAAMHTALALPDDLTVDGICEIHRALMAPSGESFGGELREEQVWIGGSGFSPHGALFVPPQPSRVRACLDDLVIYARRDNVNPIVKAAIVHAQFETIHPFIDGNGRTGRTLLHKILRRDGVLTEATLPVSAGLLHDVGMYMESLRAYQAGNPIAIVERIVEALEQAILIGSLVASALDDVLSSWSSRMKERVGASIHRLPNVLAEQPVVDSRYLARTMGITVRAANNLLDRACSYGMLRPIGTARRGIFYQADELLDVLEEISGMAGIRRVLARGRLT